MVVDVIAFGAGVYFGLRNHELTMGGLIEKSMPYNIALAGVLTAALFITTNFERNASTGISILVYLFLAFILGSLGGRLSRRIFKKREA